jgi:hypothetical protein
MLLGRFCDCHERHHWPSGNGRLPLAKVPAAAIDFARRLMGDVRAEEYLGVYYVGRAHPDERRRNAADW